MDISQGLVQDLASSNNNNGSRTHTNTHTHTHTTALSHTHTQTHTQPGAEIPFHCRTIHGNISESNSWGGTQENCRSPPPTTKFCHLFRMQGRNNSFFKYTEEQKCPARQNPRTILESAFFFQHTHPHRHKTARTKKMHSRLQDAPEYTHIHTKNGSLINHRE